MTTRSIWRLGGVLGTLFLLGCTPPRVAQQRLVSQKNMTFDGSAVWSRDSALGLQTESGRAFAGGGQGAGCTTCK